MLREHVIGRYSFNTSQKTHDMNARAGTLSWNGVERRQNGCRREKGERRVSPERRQDPRKGGDRNVSVLAVIRTFLFRRIGVDRRSGVDRRVFDRRSSETCSLL